MRTLLIGVVTTVAAYGCGAIINVSDQTARPAAIGDDAHDTESADWRLAEKDILANHVQLTFPNRFVKAGEAYFSPDDHRIIFQAIEKPADGRDADEFYAMFVADLVRDGSDRITGLADVRRISPPGSANTCGWFHPLERDVVIFGSTMVRPTASSPPGYQRSTGRYRWMFPPEMQIVRCDLRTADGTMATLEPLIDDRGAYVAECSLSADGRHLLFCSLESNGGDLFTLDLTTGGYSRIVGAIGYDGGPFFSPDGTRICYRSDRKGNHLLQLFVADLAFDETGGIIGIEREYQLTDDQNVNWCPFWHPNGRFLVYSTSRIGHHNYEIFLVDADPGDVAGSTGTIRYGAGVRRVTHADGSDVLPALNSDGTVMIWSSRRGEAGSIQLWVADFVMDLGGS